MSSSEDEKSVQGVGQPQPLLESRANEIKLRRKIDFCLVPVVSLTYISAFIDRIAIGNARPAGIEADLGLKGYDYNTALSLFFVTYIVFEIPGILLCKRIGPSKFLPICTILFGLFSLCTAFVSNFGGLCTTRFLLGFAEAPMLPGIAYYLSRFYRKDELVFRLGLYVVCAPLGGAFGGLLASAILNVNGIGSVHSWQQIFFVEGLITMGIGFFALCVLPEDPSKARWLTPEERELGMSRVAEERFEIDIADRAIGWRAILPNIFETQTLLLAMQFLLNNITVQGLAIFTPTIVGTIFPNSTSIYKNLHTVPPYICGAASTVIIPYLSWKLNKRGIFMIIEGVLMVVGYAMFIGSSSAHVRYAASFIAMIGAFPGCCIVNAWISANSVTDTGRGVSIATIAMAGNIGGLISTWSYLPSDGPDYHNGNSLNLGTSSAFTVLAIMTLVWMRRENGKKDKAQSLDDRVDMSLGRKNPAYRYAY